MKWFAICFLFGAVWFSLGGCDIAPDQPPRAIEPLRTIEIEVAEPLQTATFNALRTYARANGFRFASRTSNAPDSSKMFELRRQDFWIVGANEILPPGPPRIKGGHFDLGHTYHPTRFEVSFYPGATPATAEFYSAAIDEFIALLGSIEGVELLAPNSEEVEPVGN